MSQETQNAQPSWSKIVRTIWSKANHDYRTTVQPHVKSGRAKLGSLIESLAQKVKGSAR